MFDVNGSGVAVGGWARPLGKRHQSQQTADPQVRYVGRQAIEGKVVTKDDVETKDEDSDQGDDEYGRVASLPPASVEAQPETR